MENGAFAPKEQSSIFHNISMENGAFAPKEQSSFFHNISKYIVFQRHQKGLSWSKGFLNITNFILM